MNLKWFCWAWLMIALAACSAGGERTATPTSAAQPGATQTAATAALPGASPLPAPTIQPTPAQGKVILVAPPDLGAAAAEAARAALADLAAAAKLALETRPALRPDEIKPEFKILVFLQAPPDLPALLAAAPQAQFAVVAGSDLEAKGNLSVIRQREELRTFLGGYIITLVASDWRSIGLLPDSPAELQDAFLNGGRYWCGRCVPINGPVVLFPLVATQPAGADPAGWQSALAAQQKNVLQAVYLSPQAYSPGLLKALFAQKLILVGTQTPGDEIRPRWVATLGFDLVPALKKLWPGLAANQGGQSADASLAWSDVNEAYFTAGKQRLAQQTLAGLLDGSIGVFSVTGK